MRPSYVAGALCAVASLNAQTSFGYTFQQLFQNRLDPDASYLTTETAHFLIHYPERLSEAVPVLSEKAESSYAKVTRTLGSDPSGKTHLVLSNQSDEPSIFTQVFPHRQISVSVSKILDVSAKTHLQGLDSVKTIDTPKNKTFEISQSLRDVPSNLDNKLKGPDFALLISHADHAGFHPGSDLRLLHHDWPDPSRPRRLRETFTTQA
jgi:hypothetical protein